MIRPGTYRVIRRWLEEREDGPVIVEIRECLITKIRARAVY